jgi:hypothetical protein
MAARCVKNCARKCARTADCQLDDTQTYSTCSRVPAKYRQQLTECPGKVHTVGIPTYNREQRDSWRHIETHPISSTTPGASTDGSRLRCFTSQHTSASQLVLRRQPIRIMILVRPRNATATPGTKSTCLRNRKRHSRQSKRTPRRQPPEKETQPAPTYLPALASSTCFPEAVSVNFNSIL